MSARQQFFPQRAPKPDHRPMCVPDQENPLHGNAAQRENPRNETSFPISSCSDSLEKKQCCSGGDVRKASYLGTWRVTQEEISGSRQRSTSEWTRTRGDRSTYPTGYHRSLFQDSPRSYREPSSCSASYDGAYSHPSAFFSAFSQSWIWFSWFILEYVQSPAFIGIFHVVGHSCGR